MSFLICIGIVGFITAIILLSGQNDKGNIHYREISFVNKESVVRQIYNARLKHLRDTVGWMEKQKDTARYAKQIPIAQKAMNTTLRDSIAFSAGNSDTSIKAFTNLIVVNRDSLLAAINADGWISDTAYAHTQSVNFTYIDTTSALFKIPFSQTVVLNLQRVPKKNLIAFFASNPLFGFWLIFSIAQMTLWFLVVPLLYGTMQSVRSKLTGVLKSLFSPGNWVKSSILPLVFFGLFSYIFYFKLIDNVVVRDNYFLDGFNDKMVGYAIIGYIAAIGCFGMFLLTSTSLDLLNIHAKEKSLSITEDDPLKLNYLALKKTFDASFLASAIILSVFVLWVGIAFNAVNQTEAMRFYNVYAGKPVLTYDFVFLVGAMHTVILLLFYVPVRLKFNYMQIAEDAKASGTVSGNKLLSSLSESIFTILVTGSPLIVGILQKLISGAMAG